MAIAFRSATTAGAATGTTLSINKPTGVVDGDILILSVYNEVSATNVSAPTGFTQIGSAQVNNNSSAWLSLFWHRAASDGASYSIPITTSTWRTATLGAFSGCVSSGSPVDVSASFKATTTTTSFASVTTTAANDMIVGTTGDFGGNTFTAGTSGMTLATGSQLQDASIFYVAQASAGASGVKNITPTADSLGFTWTVALLPAATGGANVTPTAASAGGVAPAPAITTVQNPTVTPSAASAGAFAPPATVTLGVPANVSPTAAFAGGAAPAPTVSAVRSPTVQAAAAFAGAYGTIGNAGSTPPAHLTQVGNGYTDVTPKQVTRTSDNRLWIASWQFDTYPQGSSNGLTQTLRMYRADQTGPPSTFTRVDTAHEDTGVVSWSMAVGAGDLIHLVYTLRASWNSSTNIGTDNVLRYNTFNTSTQLWGTPVSLETALAVTEIGQGDELVALAVDSAGAPHVVYLKSDGTRRRVNYINKASGSWSSPVIVDDQTFGTNEKCWHPGVAFDQAGRIVVNWIRGDFNGNGTGRLFCRVNTSGTWGATVDVAGANVWIGIDTGVPLYIDTANRYHITYLDGTVNEYIQYRYSDNNGATWTGNNPGSGTAGGHNPAVGPGPSGSVRIYAHNATTTEITYFQGSGGSSTWAARVDYETPTGYDSSVNVRWARYFWWYPSTLDIVYWLSNYPTNILETGLDAGGTDVYLTPQPSSASAFLPPPAISTGTNVSVSAPASFSGAAALAPAITAGAGVTVQALPGSSGAFAPAPTPSGAATVSPTPPSAAAAAPPPIISTGSNITVSAPASFSAAAAPAPSVSAIQNPTVFVAVPASAGGFAPVAAIFATQNPTIFVGLAYASGFAPAPLIFTGPIVRISRIAFALSQRSFTFTHAARVVSFSLSQRSILLEMTP